MTVSFTKKMRRLSLLCTSLLLVVMGGGAGCAPPPPGAQIPREFLPGARRSHTNPQRAAHRRIHRTSFLFRQLLLSKPLHLGALHQLLRYLKERRRRLALGSRRKDHHHHAKRGRRVGAADPNVRFSFPQWDQRKYQRLAPDAWRVRLFRHLRFRRKDFREQQPRSRNCLGR